MLDKNEVIDHFPGAGLQLLVRTKLNVRDAPSRAAALVGRRAPPQLLVADQLLEAETFLDNSHWYRQKDSGHFFWAGGVEQVIVAPAENQAGPLDVARRADDTIRPLSPEQLAQRYGQLHYDSQPNGAIVLQDDWERRHIVDFTHALLAPMGLQRLRVHTLALNAFQDVFDAIAAAPPAVRTCLRSCAGTFVPRHMGWDTRRPLSSHSWGVAIDLNTEWNAYGSRPQVAGMIGSVNELVPYFARYGFAWGGHFSGKQRDGMHFELALR